MSKQLLKSRYIIDCFQIFQTFYSNYHGLSKDI